MKRYHYTILTLILALAALVSCTPKQGKGAKDNIITISGSIEFPDDRFPITIIQYGDEQVVLDTITLTTDNTFTHEFEVPEPGLYGIDVQKWERLNFWGEDEDIHVNFRGQDTAQIKIKNPPYEIIEHAGPNNQLVNHINYIHYVSYQRMIRAAQLMYRASESGETKWIADTRGALEESYADDDRDYETLARLYPDLNSSVLLLKYLKEGSEPYNTLVDHLKETKADYPPFANWLAEKQRKQELIERLAVGKPAPTFKINTPEGEELTFDPATISGGKVLLIDFWASWCGPCRNAVPKLKKFYKQYAAQGLEIVSISIDGKLEDWHKALEEEEMPWQQFLAPERGKEVTETYQFNGIPHFVLLDKEGKIANRQINITTLEEAIQKELEK